MKLFLSILFLVGISLYLTSCSSKSKADSKQELDNGRSSSINDVLELETYLNQIKSETRPYHFVDVRTPEEVADGTIEGSINIDFKSSDFAKNITALEKDRPMYLFCRSGNRSGQASQILVDAGYTEIYDLKGGYNAYSAGQ